jgi:hypothetical protein
MPNGFRAVALTALLALLAGCAATGSRYLSPELSRRAQAPPDPDRPAVSHRVLLVGDAGAVRTGGPDPVLATLRAHALAADSASTVVFLGDNVYVDGLPPEGARDRPEKEAILRAQLDAVAGIPGRTIFVPGNHDWKHSRPGGLAQLREQEQFVESVLGDRGAFLPSGGFPGPVEVDLGARARLLVVDTEWWLGRYARGTGEDEEADALVRDDADFLVALSEAVQRDRDRRVLVVAHHPIFSNSNHAGVAAPKKHLAPPVLGSFLVFWKRTFGQTRQDIAHPRYSAMKDAFRQIFAQRDGLVYATGHDHTLQYFPVREGTTTQHHLVSGSASKSSYVTGGRGAAFTASDKGFLVLTYYDDGSARLDAIAARAGRPLGDTLLSAPILEPDPDLAAPPAPVVAGPAPVLPERATAAPEPRYDRAGFLARTFLGDGWRRTWATPVEVPVFDVGREAGGLTPTRLGGSRQTRSLRLVDAQGHEYVLRSIDKTPNNPLQLSLRYGIARDVAEDLTSAVYPYGAVVAARLSDAAGLYHTAPRVVYVPDDPRLGRYRADFAGQLMLFEQRPDGDATPFANQGRAPDVVGTPRLMRELDGDVDHRVDARFFLRARLLDMLIGDWDRHQDQWRWAAYEPADLDSTLDGEDATRGKRYRPIARDRDWALNDRDGLLFGLTRPFVPKIQGFQEHFGNIEGLTFNGRQLDRRFLSELDRDDWREEVERFQATMSDSVLAAAVNALPAAARRQDGERILRRLRQRRDDLDEAVMRYYRMRAASVEVLGSHDGEVFRAERQRDGDLRLSVYRRKDDGSAGQRLWRRTFKADETNEVRLWARGGDDRLEVTGPDVRRPITLRFLGGAGRDEVSDSTRGTGLFLYDTRADDALVVETAGPQARVERSDRLIEAAFGYLPPTPGGLLPLPVLSSNVDDGLIVGLNLDVTTPGFGRDPYLRRQRVEVGYATATGGVYGRFEGHYPGLLGRWDGGLDVAAQSPLAHRNFFGYGGTSGRLPGANDAFYRVRLASARLAPYAQRSLMERIAGRMGPTLDLARPSRDTSRFLAEAPLPARDLNAQLLAGAEARLLVDATDNPARPTRGRRVDASVRARQGLLSLQHRYAGVRSSTTLYATRASVPWATLGLRVGGEHLVGTFPFYDAATLGGTTNLRGFRAHRFAGRTTFFAGAEPRIRLNRFRAVLWPNGEFGLLGFADAGRVWADGEPDGPWHVGYGGGLWGALSSRLGGSLTYDVSKETRALSLRLGFTL